MKDWFFPTAFSVWGDEERAAIERVIACGRFTQGEEVAAFEAEFAAFHGRAHAIMVNSGSSANLITVSALRHLDKLRLGDKAIVPALAWSTTYAPLIQLGIDLVLIDANDTWNADPFALKLHDGVKLVVACSILGNPADLMTWKTAAGVLDVPLLEDNCESLGASIDGKLCGTFGLMSTASFFYSHQVSAIEGGAVLTDDDECAMLCRMLRAHGWTRGTDLQKPGFDREYDFRVFGYNVRGLELHAAVAREQLKKLPGFIVQRRKNADLFRHLTASLPIVHPTTGGATSPFGLQFAVSDGDTRNRLAGALRAAGIDCRLPTGGSLTKHAYGARWADQPTPFADAIHDCGLFLGNGPVDLADPICSAIEVMREALA